ncbi:MAG TPA: polysaccharide deacetylase family protein, partial [Gemmatimonadaceae bacterium]|nr:polysaccharide deacetylase family protein [Gemmatimonadaceae bacterium]
MFSRFFAAPIAFAVLTACSGGSDGSSPAAAAAASDSAQVASGDTPVASSPSPDQAGSAQQARLSPADAARAPNELGRIPVVEYHLIGDSDSRWGRERGRFRRDLQLLYERGYRPVSIAQVLDRKIDLPRGLSPVVFVFDDASPGQFKYIERNGKLEIDPGSGVGIWLDFKKSHPDWGNGGVFCMLSGAAAGRSFFGDKGIEGQKSEWRFQKVKFLADNGFELCNHTLWHANLSKYPDPFVQEQIARGVLAIDSAVPGYKVRTFALPLGVWPKNRALAKSGSWTDPKSGKVTRYNFDAILEVSGGPTRSPHDPKFNPLSINRIEVFANELERTLDQLDKNNSRYV